MITDEDRLKELPAYDVESRVAARIRAHAHAVLESEATRARLAQDASAQHWFYRIVEPTALIGLGVAQLFWTVHDTLALFP